MAAGSAGGGAVWVERGYGNQPSAAAAVSQLAPAHVGTGPTPQQPSGTPQDPPLFPLVAFLITEGTEDSLHLSYLASHVELDIASNRTLLFQDIGHPNVRGPTVQRLVEDGVLTFDPNEVDSYVRAVARAGGELPYRRQEIARLRGRLGLKDEPTPLIVVVSTARPGAYAILSIPEMALSDDGQRRLWKTVQTSLSEQALRGICSAQLWDEAAVKRLQGHLDSVSDDLESGSPVAAGPSLVERNGKWELAFGGKRVRLRRIVGLRYLHALLGAPRRFDGTSAIDAAQLGAKPQSPSQELSEATDDGGLGRPGREDTSELQGGGGVDALDSRAIANIRTERERLVTASKTAEKAGDLELAQKLDEEVAAIEGHLGKNTVGGRPRVTGGLKQRVVDSVRMAVRRAIAEIAKVHPEAAEHLRSSVHLGRQLTYRPATPMTWET